MPLYAGDKLGPYEIVSPIGAGGMGEVWKARDTRLDRIVAIKTSMTEFSKRFEREARAVAALNHPNICQLYDVGPNYLVMEFIEGTPLKGPVTVEQALKYAVQICDALDAVHKKNITHRDLKPANMLITKRGIKLLDFGIANVRPVTRAEDGTLSMALTGKGEILGTLAYMSPEQVNGEEAGPRSDIFSFGLVLYEMLTGKRAFEGKSQASVIAAILDRATPSLAEVAPAALDRVLKRCLEKDPENRWQTARDLKAELEWIASAPEPGSAVPSVAKNRPPPGRLAWIAAGLLATGLVVAGRGWYRATRPAELKPLVQLDVDLGSEYIRRGDLPAQASGADVIISPDGAMLVFVSKGRLFTRRLNQPKATELAGTEGAETPFFSPDGQWVAFSSGGKLKKISAEGGAAITLCDAPALRGGAWGEDHTIIAALTTTRDGLRRIPDSGGVPQPLTELAEGEYTHRWPQILPGGRAVLFTTSTAAGLFDGANIEVMSLQNRRRKTLHRGGTFGRYLPTLNGSGYLVYLNKGTLFALAFDPGTLEVRGTPSPVVQAVSFNPADGSAQFDFSRDGTLVYRSGGAGGMLALQWLDSEGKLQSLPAKPGAYGELRLSPDGKLVALTVPSGNGTDIWTYDWQRDAMSKLTFGDGAFSYPVWSPDGRYIAFSAHSEIFWTRADGAGKPQLLTQSKAVQWPRSFSPDGKRLAFAEFGSGLGDLWTVLVDNEGGGPHAVKAQVFLQTAANEESPAFSPDGRWIAYGSDETGNSEIYVRAFPDKGRKWQISNSGGVVAIWSPNGRELFYRTLDQQIMVASYTTKGDFFAPDKPRLWSSTRLADTSFPQNLDISPDGKRFIVLTPTEPAGQQRANNQITFLLNFLDEVRSRTDGAR